MSSFIFFNLRLPSQVVLSIRRLTLIWRLSEGVSVCSTLVFHKPAALVRPQLGVAAVFAQQFFV